MQDNSELKSVLPYLESEQYFNGKSENYDELMAYIKGVLGKEIGMEEIAEICRIYDYATKQGARFYEVAEACKDVLKILEMPENPYIDPKIHKRLISMPDTYYDFVWGMENNLEKSAELQELMKICMANIPDMNSSECIILASMFNSKINLNAYEIEIVLKSLRRERIIDLNKLPNVRGETTIIQDNHGWRISSISTKKRGYTIRVKGAVCLIDYKNICIGGCLLESLENKNECAMFIGIGGDNRFDDIRSLFLCFITNKLRLAGVHKVYSQSLNKVENILLNAGFENQNDYFMKHCEDGRTRIVPRIEQYGRTNFKYLYVKQLLEVPL